MSVVLEETYREPQISEIANQIADMLQEIRFGSIEIIVHEGKVMHIERKEKLRFDSKK
jgi:hypothetical protein